MRVSRERRIAVGELKNLLHLVMVHVVRGAQNRLACAILHRMKAIIRGDDLPFMATDRDIELALEFAAKLEAIEATRLYADTKRT